jgi:uncharacterized protein YjiK
MKWYYWVVIAVGAYLLFIRSKKSTTLPASASTGLTSAVQGAPAQYDTNPENYHVVPDQQGYPGFYQSSVDGSWYNPTTGDFYSAGSSPPRIVEPDIDWQTIDTTPLTGAPPPETDYVVY